MLMLLWYYKKLFYIYFLDFTFPPFHPFLFIQMVLERYFSMSGSGAELVLPEQPELQEKLRKGPSRDWDF